MIDIQKVDLIDVRSLRGWLNEHLTPLLPPDPNLDITILPSHYDTCRGEAKWFCRVELDDLPEGPKTLLDLVACEDKQRSTIRYKYYHIADVLSFARSMGYISGSTFYALEQW